MRNPILQKPFGESICTTTLTNRKAIRVAHIDRLFILSLCLHSSFTVKDFTKLQWNLRHIRLPEFLVRWPSSSFYPLYYNYFVNPYRNEQVSLLQHFCQSNFMLYNLDYFSFFSENFYTPVLLYLSIVILAMLQTISNNFQNTRREICFGIRTLKIRLVSGIFVRFK